MDLAINRQAPVERIALGNGQSWVDLVSGFVLEPEGVFQSLFAQTAWQQAEVLRYDRYIPEKRLGAWVSPQDQPPALRQTGLHLDAAYHARFSGAAAILYRDGTDFQGLHSDREMKWLDDTLVAIVVLGQRRPFVLRERGPSAQVVDRTPPGQLEGDISLTPGEGDLLVMGGRCQRDWVHGVPAAATDRPRISVTWRWSSRRGRPDTAPGYFDGRQFSDAPRQPGTRIGPNR
jgi:alkylated DNA repair dioxygenase AlkB